MQEAVQKIKYFTWLNSPATRRPSKGHFHIESSSSLQLVKYFLNQCQNCYLQLTHFLVKNVRAVTKDTRWTTDESWFNSQHK